MTETLDRLRTALERRYVITRELGRGGMSIVYAARDKRHDRDVAVKVFPPALAAAIGSERFKREIDITSKLSHPHILPLFDSGEAAGAMYYVMPLVVGESLRDRLDRDSGGLPLGDVLRLADQISQALDYAHSHGVIHRDVTPDNILLSNDNALLADFGVARLVEGETLTESGMPFGTAMYRSPEQASGHAKVGAESDVYSVACVLYEALGGAASRNVLSNRFVAPVPALKNVPFAVNATLIRAMSLDPSDRFSSAGEFVRALRSRFQFRYRWRSIAMAAAVLIVVAGAGLGFSMFRRQANEPVRTRVVVGRFVNRTGDPAYDALSEMAGDYIARGLAQTHMLEVIDSRSSGAERISPVGVGAATLVQGSVYRRGDQVHIETQVTDPRTGRVIIPTPPVEGPPGAGTSLVESLRQRLMGNFAAMFGPAFDAWESASLPPSFEAYEEILAGDASLGRNEYGEGLEHYRRAAAMDTSYVGARALAIVAASINEDCAVADSIAATLETRLTKLSTLDRGRVEWGVDQCHGDLEKSFDAGKRVLASAPRSISFNILTSVTALELFRPSEAIAILNTLSPDRVQFSAAQRQFHTSFTASALHELGQYDRELDVYREGLRAMPDEPHFLVGELTALASLGRTTQLGSRISDLENGNRRYDRTLWSPGEIRLCVALELAAHGRESDGNALMASAASWSRVHLPTDGSVPVDVVCRHHLFIPMYYGGYFDETRAFYRRVLDHDSTDFQAHEALGAIAARQHDLEVMSRMDKWLADHALRERGRSAYSRARIAALSGQTARAVKLLEQAFTEGMRFRLNIHTDPDLKSLRNLPEYRRLLTVRG